MLEKIIFLYSEAVVVSLQLFVVTTWNIMIIQSDQIGVFGFNYLEVFTLVYVPVQLTDILLPIQVSS